MNENAKEIWQAWLDGKGVQFKRFGIWKDANPSTIAKDQQPDKLPNCWRVKSPYDPGLWKWQLEVTDWDREDYIIIDTNCSDFESYVGTVYRKDDVPLIVNAPRILAAANRVLKSGFDLKLMDKGLISEGDFDNLIELERAVNAVYAGLTKDTEVEE